MTITCGWFPSPFPCLTGKFEGKPSKQRKSVWFFNNGISNDDDEDYPPPSSNRQHPNETSRSTSTPQSFECQSTTANNPSGADQSELSRAEPRPSRELEVPLNDQKHKSSFGRESYEMSVRSQNPRIKLLTSSSIRQLSDFTEDVFMAVTGEDSEEDESENDWSISTHQADPPAHTFFDVGMMITMQDGLCQFDMVPDRNYPEIHPNVYAPADLENMRILYGGGSGVAVFAGESPPLGDVVMKHGGYKDLQELFALATISEELSRRGRLTGNVMEAKRMQDRLPSFKFIYLSPRHIRSRGTNIITDLQNFVRNWSLTTLASNNSLANNPKLLSLTNSIQEKAPQVQMGMNIRIYEGDDENTSFILNTANEDQWKLSLLLPSGSTHFSDSRRVQVRGNAYESLGSVVKGLSPIMTQRALKFTLGQKTIGGPNPKTGNQWLYEGKLSGNVLQTLMDQMLQVIHSLEMLTLPEEVDVIDEIRNEVLSFENSIEGLRANDISKTADAFVGNAIKKNFHPEKGRQRFLREICANFRDGHLVLMPEEEIPATHLGKLLRSGALMSDSFLNSPTEPTVLQLQPHFWRNILRRSVDSRSDISPAALRRVWTCGLTDAGIHNLFVSEHELYLFDLGEPQMMSLPGFLTKFLFSFFHTLGMEDDGNGSWVRRFVVVGDQLGLTRETKDLLPKAYEAFQTCLDRIVEELFDGDRGMRWLLLEYVTMQLMSDTAFCIQKWEIKGGGKARDGNHQIFHEKWLWRALWDIYIAFDINTAESWCRLDVIHPHNQDSYEPDTMQNFADGKEDNKGQNSSESKTFGRTKNSMTNGS